MELTKNNNNLTQNLKKEPLKLVDFEFLKDICESAYMDVSFAFDFEKKDIVVSTILFRRAMEKLIQKISKEYQLENGDNTVHQYEKICKLINTDLGFDDSSIISRLIKFFVITSTTSHVFGIDESMYETVKKGFYYMTRNIIYKEEINNDAGLNNNVISNNYQLKYFFKFENYDLDNIYESIINNNDGTTKISSIYLRKFATASLIKLLKLFEPKKWKKIICKSKPNYVTFDVLNYLLEKGYIASDKDYKLFFRVANIGFHQESKFKINGKKIKVIKENKDLYNRLYFCKKFESIFEINSDKIPNNKDYTKYIQFIASAFLKQPDSIKRAISLLLEKNITEIDDLNILVTSIKEAIENRDVSKDLELITFFVYRHVKKQIETETRRMEQIPAYLVHSAYYDSIEKILLDSNPVERLIDTDEVLKRNAKIVIELKSFIKELYPEMNSDEAISTAFDLADEYLKDFPEVVSTHTEYEKIKNDIDDSFIRDIIFVRDNALYSQEEKDKYIDMLECQRLQNIEPIEDILQALEFENY